MYRVHVQNIGWQEWKTDGEIAGTSGQSLRLEAIQIKIVPKQKKARIYIDTPINGDIYYSSSNINVQGWKMANVSNSTIKAYIDDKEIEANSVAVRARGIGQVGTMSVDEFISKIEDEIHSRNSESFAKSLVKA